MAIYFLSWLPNSHIKYTRPEFLEIISREGLQNQELIKIGYTERHPDDRLPEVSRIALYSAELFMIGYLLRAGLALERDWHHKFAKHRIPELGEWFISTSELRDAISMALAKDKDGVNLSLHRTFYHKLYQVLDDINTVKKLHDVARHLNISVSEALLQIIERTHNQL